MSDSRPAALSRGPATKPRSYLSRDRASRPPATRSAGDAPACARPAADPSRPCATSRPVDPVEGHDVGDRAERDEIEQCREIRRRAIGEVAALAQRRARGEQHVEHDPDAGEVLARKGASGLIRIDDQRGGRQRERCGGQVVIGHEHLDAGRGRRRDAVVARDAVVDGHDEARRHPGRFGDDLRRQTVAVFEAVGYEESDDRAHACKSAHRHGARRGAVGIVIGDDHDFLAARYRVGKPRRRRVDALHRRETRARSRGRGRARSPSRCLAPRKLAPAPGARRTTSAAAQLRERCDGRFPLGD
jgi:hypothetical protein